MNRNQMSSNPMDVLRDTSIDPATRQQAFAAAIKGQGISFPHSVAPGAGQDINGAINGFALRNHFRDPFPTIPGAGQSGMIQGLPTFNNNRPRGF